MSQLLENIKSARLSGVPLLAVVTQDQPATVEAVCGSLNNCPKIKWDCINGLQPLNEEGQQALQAIGAAALEASSRFVLALKTASTFPSKTLVFCYNAHASIGEPPVVQAIQNLREIYKENKRTLVLLGSSFADMRLELQADVVTLREELPSDAQLEAVIRDLHESASKPVPEEKLPRMMDAVRGLTSLFTVEQVVAMSFRKAGLDMDALWSRKKAAIESKKGVTIRKGTVRYADLAGMDAVQGFLTGMRGKVKAVLFWDEIEKMLGGAGQDGTNIQSDFMGVCLKKMEGLRWYGITLVGVPGAGKTALADATACEFDVPLLEMDFGGMKSKWVGDSEENVRGAFDVAEGIGGRDVLVFATCNRLNSLPAEFRRRFWFGTWYADIPTLEEQEPIKAIYERKLGVPHDWPNTSTWTGAEIRNCAELSVLTGKSLKECAGYIVPIATADPESVEQLRKVADGRFLSVSYEGRWTRDHAALPTGKAKRQIGS